MVETRELMSDYKFSSGYARWNEEKQRKETWGEAVDRVMAMHEKKFKKHFDDPDFKEMFEFTKQKYKEKYFLASMRSLQFGGDSIEKHNAKMFNCLGANTDRLDFFGEAMYLLLCGCGVGFSVQKHHINELPQLVQKTKSTYRFEIPDSIEGWADSVQILISSYFVKGEHKFSKYSGYNIEFDYSNIRPKGALISGGFKAPGHEGLKNSIEKIRTLLDAYVETHDTISPLIVYDVVMHCSDAVLSGGIRRSACIVLFSKDDDDMMKAKTGDWFLKNPQRARSNNSVVLYRDKIDFEEFNEIMTSIKEFGEPGFYFSSNPHTVTNPCVTDDTWVATDKGNLQVKDLIGKNDFKILLDGKTYDLESNGFFHTGVKSVNKIVFTTGREIKITPNHLMMTPNGWVEAGKLIVGDVIKISRLFEEIESNETSYDEVLDIIEDYEITDVYDVTVKDVHAFSANGLHVHNCCEIGFYPIDKTTGKTGWAGCNLTDINGAKCKTEEEFYDACAAASFMGTLQAAYTDLKYLDVTSRNVFTQEALLGVSMTGMMNNPKICLHPQIQINGANIVKNVNKKYAAIIGIEQSARTTCIKPSGNSAVLLGSSSGIHGEHSPRYFRNVQVNKEEEEGAIIRMYNPLMVEESVYSANKTDDVVSFPIESPKDSLYKKDLIGTKQLEYVLLTQQNWVKHGTNPERCVAPDIYHNVSNTISVDDWDAVSKYIFDNRENFTGVSLLSSFGDKDYNQAPFTSVIDSKEILRKYGNAGIFASGLIVDALKAFNNNLWDACGTALGFGEKISHSDEDILAEIAKTPIDMCWRNLGYPKRVVKTLVEQDMKPSVEEYRSHMGDKLASSVFNYGLKVDVLRKMKKFAKKYFDNNIREMTYCLKDVYNWHKWVNIEMNYVEIDWEEQDLKPNYTDIDTIGAIACSGGACEISF